jgi:thiamine-phosphate pyrophosphorylase
MDYTLYLVTDAGISLGRTPTQVVEAAIRGGVTVVQYREKSASTRRMMEEARELRQLCRAGGVPFIVNDRIDVALAVDADGVHVGQDDMPAPLARRLIGKRRILGVSAADVDEARKAEEQGADYVGASPVFATPTKPDAPPPVGIDGLRRMAGAVSIPVVAIGGMNAENARSIILAGAAGVAVISAIVGARDVEAAARAIREAIKEAVRG